jgi:hypothetical protein
MATISTFFVGPSRAVVYLFTDKSEEASLDFSLGLKNEYEVI